MTLQIRLAELDDFIEFSNECRVPAGSAGGGQFASCGKAFSRMSAHPDHRRKPIPGFSLDLSPEDDAEAAAITGHATARAENVIRRAYEGDLGGGVKSVVTHLRGYIPTYDAPQSRYHDAHNNVEVRGNLVNEDGQKMGEFIRTIVRDERTLVVKHDLLEINAKYRGQGIADRFNARAVATYEAMGVDRIVLDAAMTHGGYAWARQGFRIYGDNADRHAIVERLASGVRIDEKGRVEGHALTHPEREDSQELAALVRASAAGEDIQPIHLASIGENRRNGKDTWFGKDLLLGATWPGVYYLDRGNPVTASAVDLHYADLRPAFRDPETITFSMR